MRQFFIALFAILWTSSPLFAQDDPLPDSVAEPYVAYEEAMRAQNYDAASVSAENAWRASHSARIDPSLIGILAANYAELAQELGNYDDAYDAWRASTEVAVEIGVSAEEQARRWHYASFSAFMDGEMEDAWQASDTVSDLIPEIDTSLMEEGFLLSHYVLAAKANQSDERSLRARGFAVAGIAYLEEANQTDGRNYADFHLIAGLGSIQAEDWVEAALALNMAEGLFSQTGATRDAAISGALNEFSTASMDDEEEWEYVLQLQSSSFPSDTYWDDDTIENQRLIAYKPYPMIEYQWVRRRMSGTADIRYDIGPDGRTQNVQLIDSDLRRPVTSSLIETVESWRFAPQNSENVPFPVVEKTAYFEFSDGYLSRDNQSDGPMPIYRVEPNYPISALERGYQGVSVVMFDLSEAGHPINIEVLFSSPEGAFETSSIRAVEDWRYEALQEGDAPETRENLTTRFTFQMRN